MDIIIIDDGSIDSTASIVESLIPAYSPYLKLVRHSKNLGKGQALITGFDTSWVISKIAGKKVSDVQSGYRYLKTIALEKIKLKTKNFDTEPEIIFRAGWHGMKILNIPIKTIYHDDFVSYVNPVKDTIKFFKLVFNSLKWKREFMKQSFK